MNIKEYTKKDGTKVYRANVYLGVDSLTGKQVRKVITAKSEKMCNTKISRAINEFEKNGQTVRKVSVDDFKDIAMLWFDSYKLGVKPRTVQIMQTRLNNYVLPHVICSTHSNFFKLAFFYAFCNQCIVNSLSTFFRQSLVE